MTSAFSVQTRRDGDGVIRLALAGEIDRDVVEELTTLVAETAEQHSGSHIIVDLRDVSFLAAAGVRALLRGRTEALRRGCSYRVTNAEGMVQWVLDTTGTANVLDPSRDRHTASDTGRALPGQPADRPHPA